MKLLTGFTSFVFAIYISTASISSYAQELIIEQSEGSSTGVVSPISRQQALSFSNRLAQLTDDFIEILLEDIGTDQVIRKKLVR